MTEKSSTDHGCNTYFLRGDSDAASKVCLDLITRPAYQKIQKECVSIEDGEMLQWIIENYILH